MVYTLEEKRKMDDLMAAFADYVAGHTEFDVAYSEKTGYVRLIIDEGADQVFFSLRGFTDLVEMFCMEIVCEETEKLLSKDPYLENEDVDYDKIRLLIQEYIDRLEEAHQPQVAEIVNKYLLERQRSPHLP